MLRIQAPLYYDKNDQRSSEAIRLEELATGAIVLASHAGGFGKVAFPKFLGELLYELGVSEDDQKLYDAVLDELNVHLFVMS
ncbi:hypothetical protein P3T76_002985 [Phytophthora citrophthora]|uniref:Uncharacterized protein n=1 Tax=Phytophthora citrophthora TaxID=4793 RepID=A0AAD9LSW3_9STRA|nr:hypothetical protein P3T76_002985 [Phytophthora citrophthora]